jgi:hypothetical protein
MSETKSISEPGLSLAEQNDAFRRGSHVFEGKRVHTQAIDALGAEAVRSIWSLVQSFDAFTSDNDPYGEHDFGSFVHPSAGKIFWKIDYYDVSYQYGSEQPRDRGKTRRVLTVMLADDY